MIEILKKLEEGLSPLERISGLFTNIDDKLDKTNQLLRILILRDAIPREVYNEILRRISQETLREFVEREIVTEQEIQLVERYFERERVIEREIIRQVAEEVVIIDGTTREDVGSAIRKLLSALSLRWVGKVTVGESVVNLQEDLIGTELQEVVYVMLRAHSGNTGIIYWGTESVTPDEGLPISADEAYTLRVDPKEIYLVADTAGQSLYVAIFTKKNGITGEYYVRG